MLDFAIEYRAALDGLTATRNLNLRDYELDANEWELAVQLRDVLRVCFRFLLLFN